MAVISKFRGFCDETFEFFMAIAFNNNRAFFQENRDWYLRAVREPCLALADALADTIEGIDADMERRPHRVLSRINRDIRFTRDKSPYRDHLWLAFRHTGEELQSTLCFYAEVRATSVSYGMGVYKENRELMGAVRRSMEAKPEAFASVCLPLLEEFSFFGEANRRVKPPENLPQTLHPWYTAKGFYLEKTVTDYELICSARLAEEINNGFLRLKPLYEMIRACQ